MKRDKRYMKIWMIFLTFHIKKMEMKITKKIGIIFDNRERDRKKDATKRFEMESLSK